MEPEWANMRRRGRTNALGTKAYANKAGSTRPPTALEEQASTPLTKYGPSCTPGRDEGNPTGPTGKPGKTAAPDKNRMTESLLQEAWTTEQEEMPPPNTEHTLTRK